MAVIVLTDEQQAAVAWIVQHVTAGDPVVALRGLAGTGKTTIIPALEQALKEAGIGTALGAATHRAKTMVVFVQYHDFTATKRPTIGEVMPRMQRTDTDMKPPSAPLLNADPHEPGDIPDPAVPPGTISATEEAIFGPEPSLADIPNGLDEAGQPLLAPRMAQEASNDTAPVSVPATVPPLPEGLMPLAHGFCQYLQARFGETLNEVALRMTKEVSATIDGMVHYAQGAMQSNEHMGYQLSNALEALHKSGLTVHSSPYELTLQVLSPEGFPVTLTLRETTSKALMEKLAGLSGYLAQKGYTGQTHALV